MKFIKDLIVRFTSRKFLLASGAALTAFGNGDDKAGYLAIGAYIGIEGLADVAGRFASQKYVQPKVVQIAATTAQTQATIDAMTDRKADRNTEQIVPGGFTPGVH